MSRLSSRLGWGLRPKRESIDVEQRSESFMDFQGAVSIAEMDWVGFLVLRCGDFRGLELVHDDGLERGTSGHLRAYRMRLPLRYVR